MANAPPPKPASQRAGVSRSRLPSHPRRSQTLTDMRCAMRLSSSRDEFSVMASTDAKSGTEAHGSVDDGIPYTSCHESSSGRASLANEGGSVDDGAEIMLGFSSVP